MANYPYQYFAGANVVVELEGMPLHEAAGLSFSINESKIPLYGYSSRHFDAVGRGKVLVHGSLIINYIHKNYLLKTVEVAQSYKYGAGLNNSTNLNKPSSNRNIEEFLKNDDNRLSFIDDILENPAERADYVKALQNYYWKEGNQNPNLQSLEYVDVTNQNMHDLSKALSFKVTFGERTDFNNFSGITGLVLSGVHFIGQSQQIQIDESVIIEEYQFFARNLHGILNANRIQEVQGSVSINGEVSTDPEVGEESTVFIGPMPAPEDPFTGPERPPIFTYLFPEDTSGLRQINSWEYTDIAASKKNYQVYDYFKSNLKIP